MTLDELEATNGGRGRPRENNQNTAPSRRNPTGNGIHDRMDEWDVMAEAYMNGAHRDHFGFRLPHRKPNEPQDKDPYDPYDYIGD